MKYNLFLFDLDDTLLDFKASEAKSFALAMADLGVKENVDKLFADYQVINADLWRKLERAETSKEHLKVERFRQTFLKHQIDIDPEKASTRYLETLPETVVLIDGAVELCEKLSQLGEIGIITNGIQYVQKKRIENSKISSFFSFVSVSDECGFAKPDSRFFEFTVNKAKSFVKENTIIVGDRLDADILGAQNFGIDSIWFNPEKKINDSKAKSTFEVSKLNEIIVKLTLQS